MLYLLGLLGVVITVGALARRHGDASSASLARSAVRLGVLVSVLRLSAYWSGLALYAGHGDWRQSVGYALLILSSVAELAIAPALTGSRSASPLLVGGFIVLTSAALGWVWAWLRTRWASR